MTSDRQFEKIEILAIIPARGGSKGIPRKNLLKFFDHSLVGWAAKTASESKFISKSLVSTDDQEIADEAQEFGAVFLGPRPKDLSSDMSTDQPVLKYELETAEQRFRTSFRVIVMLQPTSPLRTAEDIDRCIQKLIDERASAVWTVSPVPLHFHYKKQFVMSDTGEIKTAHSGPEVIRRQDLRASYRRNGVAYALTREVVVNDPKLRGKKCIGLTLDHPTANIDSMEDFEHAKSFVKISDGKIRFIEGGDR